MIWDMLGINPDDFTIYLNPEIKQGGYEILEGERMKGIKPKIQPSNEALEIRWHLFLKNQ